VTSVTAPRRAGRPARHAAFAWDALYLGGFFAVAVLVWWLASIVVDQAFLLPAPGAVAEKFAELILEGETYSELAITLMEIFSAFAIAAAAGIPVGLAIGWYRLARKAYEPLLANLYAVPLVIFYPVFSLALGLGSASKIAFSAIYGFFPVAITTVASASSIRPSLVLAARSMGASGTQLLRTVVLPSTAPGIVAGLQLAMVLVTLGVIAGEFLAGSAGLGYLLATSGQAYRTVELFAYIAITLLVALFLNGCTALLAHIARRRFHG
jgi:ABC-type nitrate/sulfonate/bicarbonate transport system permease component